MGILKKAAATTWRYKILWLFGLFVGGWGGSQSPNWRTNAQETQQWQDTGGDWPALDRQLESWRSSAQRLIDSGDWVQIALIIAAVVIVIGVIWFILSVAAQGGIVRLAQDALAGRPIHGMDGWHAGFSLWGRVFGVSLVLLVPVVIVFMILAALGGAVMFWSFAGHASIRESSTVLGVLAGIGIIVGIAMIPVSVVLGIMREIALRRVVLEEASVGRAISQAWQDLWGSRGVWGMWLTLLIAGIISGIVFAIVMGIISAIIIVPTVLAFLASSRDVSFWLMVAAGVMVIIAIPAATFGAAYSAFQSVAWTEFYERMMGRTPAVS